MEKLARIVGRPGRPGQDSGTGSSHAISTSSSRSVPATLRSLIEQQRRGARRPLPHRCSRRQAPPAPSSRARRRGRRRCRRGATPSTRCATSRSTPRSSARSVTTNGPTARSRPGTPSCTISSTRRSASGSRSGQRGARSTGASPSGSRAPTPIASTRWPRSSPGTSSQGREPARAVRHLHAAAARALEVSAPREALEHLTTARDALPSIADEPSAPTSSSGSSSCSAARRSLTDGWSSPTAESALVRARELAGELADDAELASTLHGLGDRLRGPRRVRALRGPAPRVARASRPSRAPRRDRRLATS